MKHIPVRHEAARPRPRGQVATAVLAGMTREYWRASQVLRGRAIDRPCDRATALRFLANLARCCNYDRLRCAADGTLVSLGFVGVERLVRSQDTKPVA